VETVITEFQKDNGILLRLAEKRREEGDLTGAVSVYRSVLSTAPFDFKANAGLAEIYADMDLSTEAVNCWFRALSAANDVEERARCYNGIGANYYFLGKDLLSMHYFGSQLSIDPYGDYEYNDVIEDLQRAAVEAEPKRFYIAYDKADEDKDEIKKARALCDDGKLNEALIILAKIPDTSPRFKESLELIAFILILQEKYETAMDIADHILYLDGDNFTALYVLCTAYQKTGKPEKSEAFYKKLLTKELSEDNVLHMLMLTIDTGREEDALGFVNRILKDTPYSVNMLFVRGIINYNTGRYEECVEDFKTVLTLTPNPVVEKRLKEVLSDLSERPYKLPYELDVKDVEMKYRLDELARRFESMGQGETLSFEDIRDHCDCIIKCRFTDLFSTGIHMGLAVDAAKTYDYLKQVLLDISVSDEIKCVILKELILLNVNVKIKCVVAHVYREFTLSFATFKGYAAELFSTVYAEVAANLYVIAPEKISLLKLRIKKYKDAFEDNCGDANCDPKPIAAAVFHLLKISRISSKAISCEIFSVTEEALEHALKLIKKESLDEGN